MIDEVFFNWLKHIIDMLPDIGNIYIPEGAYQGIDNMTSLLGLLMPFQLYKPLLTFILALTSFRITYAIYLQIRKK